MTDHADTRPTGTGHDAARCSACGLLGGDHTLWCAAAPAEPPVAAPDHARTIRFALGMLPDLEETEFHLATAALDALLAERQQVEDDLRREWWLNHGHGIPALYGDDGEMACNACPADFKRDPLERLREVVFVARAERAAAVLAGEGDATP